MEGEVKQVVLALGFVLTAAPAMAQTQIQTIAPAEAKTHVGQTVTVTGPVGSVSTLRSGMTFINMGGRYPDNAFTAVILTADKAKFPDLRGLDGKTVEVTGAVSLYRGKPEIVLKTADQMKAE